MLALSPDTVTNITYGSVMVVIGLAGIWIVKWSTDRMVRVTQGLAVSDEESMTTLVQRTTIEQDMSSQLFSRPLLEPESGVSALILRVLRTGHWSKASNSVQAMPKVAQPP